MEDTYKPPLQLSRNAEDWLTASIKEKTPELKAARKKAKIGPRRPLNKVEDRDWLTNAHISTRLAIGLPVIKTYSCGGYAWGNLGVSERCMSCRALTADC